MKMTVELTCENLYQFRHALRVESRLDILIHTLQHTATRCDTLQHAATRCNTPQHFTSERAYTQSS